MHRTTRLILTGLIPTALLLASPGVAACLRPDGAERIENGIADWINAERRARGLRALRINDLLDRAATAHACDMARRGVLTHTGRNGTDLRARLRHAGYRLRTAVENIARSPRGSVEEARALWHDSAAHWANVMNPALDEVGIGLATDGTYVYYVYLGAAPR